MRVGAGFRDYQTGPTNLVLQRTQGQATLTWNDNSNNETGFEIIAMSGTNDSTVVVDTVSTNTTRYTLVADPSTSGAQGVYAVRSVTAVEKSFPSNWVVYYPKGRGAFDQGTWVASYSETQTVLQLMFSSVPSTVIVGRSTSASGPWTEVGRLSASDVCRYSASCGVYHLYDTIGASAYGNTYYYRIQGQDTEDNFTYPMGNVMPVTVTTLEAPTNLRVEFGPNSSTTFRWQNQSSRATKVVLSRCTPPADFDTDPTTSLRGADIELPSGRTSHTLTLPLARRMECILWAQKDESWSPIVSFPPIVRSSVAPSQYSLRPMMRPRKFFDNNRSTGVVSPTVRFNYGDEWPATPAITIYDWRALNVLGVKFEEYDPLIGHWQSYDPMFGDSAYSHPLRPNTTYKYRGRFYNSDYDYAYSDEATLSTGVTMPAPIVTGTPTGSQALSDTQIRLVWRDQSSDETGFRIDRKQYPAGTWQEAGRAGAAVTTFTDTRLAPTTTYSYRTVSLKAGNAPSDQSWEYPDPTDSFYGVMVTTAPLPAPTASLYSQDASTIRLTLSGNGAVDRYGITRTFNHSGFPVVNPYQYGYGDIRSSDAALVSQPWGDAVPSDAAVASYYIISSVSAGGGRSLSAPPINVVVPPRAPNDFTATRDGGAIAMRWTDSSFRENGWRAQRKVGEGSWATIATVTETTSVLTARDSSPPSDALVIYRVVGYNDGGQGIASNEVSIDLVATVVSVSISPDPVSVVQGSQKSVHATAIMSDGSMKVLKDDEVLWGLLPSGQTTAHLIAGSGATPTAVVGDQPSDPALPVSLRVQLRADTTKIATVGVDVRSNVAQMTQIRIQPRSVRLTTVGSTSQQQLSITATYENGTEGALAPDKVNWSVDPATVANIATTQPGKLLANVSGPGGNAVVKAVLATNAAVFDSIPITVRTVGVESAEYKGDYAVESTYTPASPPPVVCSQPRSQGSELRPMLRWCNGRLGGAGCENDPPADPILRQVQWSIEVADAGVTQAPIGSRSYFARPLYRRHDVDRPRQREFFYSNRLLPGTAYQWAVEIKNANGESSGWSACQFTTKELPDLVVDALSARIDSTNPQARVDSALPSLSANTIIAGMPTIVSATVRNAGRAPSPGFLMDLYHRSAAPTSAVDAQGLVSGSHPRGGFRLNNGATETIDNVFTPGELFAEVSGDQTLWAYADSQPTINTHLNGEVEELNETNNARSLTVRVLKVYDFGLSLDGASGTVSSTTTPAKVTVRQGDTVTLRIKATSVDPAASQAPRPITLRVVSTPANIVTFPAAGSMATVGSNRALIKDIVIQTQKCPAANPNCTNATPVGDGQQIVIRGATALPAWDQRNHDLVVELNVLAGAVAGDLTIRSCSASAGGQSTEASTNRTIVVARGTNVTLAMQIANIGTLATSPVRAIFTRDAPQLEGGVGPVQIGSTFTVRALVAPLGATVDVVDITPATFVTSGLLERTYPIYAQVDTGQELIEQNEVNNLGVNGDRQPCGYVVVRDAVPTTTTQAYTKLTHSWPWGLGKEIVANTRLVGTVPDSGVTDVGGGDVSYQLSQTATVTARDGELPPTTAVPWKLILTDDQVEQDNGQIQALCVRDQTGAWSVSTDGLPKAVHDKNDEQTSTQTTTVTVPPGVRMTAARTARLDGTTAMNMSPEDPRQNELLFVAEKDATGIPTQTITIANALRGTVSWALEPASRPDWFTITPTNGTAGSLTVSIPDSATSVNPQTRTFDAFVAHRSSAAACVSRIPIRVTLIVTPRSPLVNTPDVGITGFDCRAVVDHSGNEREVGRPTHDIQLTSRLRAGTRLRYRAIVVPPTEVRFAPASCPTTNPDCDTAIGEIATDGGQATVTLRRVGKVGRKRDYETTVRIRSNAGALGGATDIIDDPASGRDMVLACNVNTIPSVRATVPPPSDSCDTASRLSTFSRSAAAVYDPARPKQPRFSWSMSDSDGDTQQAFKIKVTDCRTGAVVYDPVIESAVNGCQYGSSATAGNTIGCGAAPTLRWNTAYNWYIRLQDDRADGSGRANPAWSGSIADGGAFTLAGTFRTDPHSPPNIAFDWKPKEVILVGQEVTFAANGIINGKVVQCFTDGAPETPQQCYQYKDTNGAVVLHAELHPTYEWDFGDDTQERCTIKGSNETIDARTDAVINGCSLKKHTYKNEGAFQVQLCVDDGVRPESVRACSTAVTLKVISPLFKRALPQ